MKYPQMPHAKFSRLFEICTHYHFRPISLITMHRDGNNGHIYRRHIVESNASIYRPDSCEAALDFIFSLR